MPHKPTSLHRTWNVAAHDDEGNGMDLRLAVEQTGERGYAAYAYWDRKPEDKDEMIVASTDYADSGPAAFRSLRSKLESDRGVKLESDDIPDWLMAHEWQQVPPRPHEPDESTE
jgi:hypothetical protein